MVNVCKRDENVKLIAQSMKLPNGGNAQLDVGNNQEYILPFKRLRKEPFPGRESICGTF